jgi:hypothetical protein
VNSPIVLLMLVVVSAGAFALASSMLFDWASGKSPLWNIGFFLVLILAGAAVLLLTATLLSRRLAP